MHLIVILEIASYSKKPHRMAPELGNYIESNHEPSKICEWNESDITWNIGHRT